MTKASKVLIVTATLVLASSTKAQDKLISTNWNLEDNHRYVDATFGTTPPASIRFDAGDVDDIISHLGEFRMLMWPEVEKEFKLGQRVGVISDPFWATEPDVNHQNTLLHMRDPRFGWLHYAIPRDEALKLVNYIQNQLNLPTPESRWV